MSKTERTDVRGLTAAEKKKLVARARKEGTTVSAIVIEAMMRTVYPVPNPKPRAEGARTARIDLRLTKEQKDALSATARRLRRTISSLALEAIEAL